MKIRIATRNSPLALWQAEHVASLLRRAEPSLDVVFCDRATEGDRRLDVPISAMGGKGVFSKEIQRLVINGSADIAVHSAKDLQAETPEELTVAAFPPRGDARDALVGAALTSLPHGGVVATGSARRRIQLAHVRPDLQFVELRGNIATRLSKLDGCDGLLMAAVALERLGLDSDPMDPLDVSVMIPQVGQGALAVECRSGDSVVAELLASIDHEPTRVTVTAERDFLRELGGDCELPAGAHASLAADGTVSVVGLLGAEEADGSTRIEKGKEAGPPEREPGRMLAQRLRSRL